MEVYLHDLGLSSEFLEIKKNKQKKEIKFDLSKFKTSGVLNMKKWVQKLHTQVCLLLGTPSSWLRNLPTAICLGLELYYSSEQILQFHNRGYDPEHCPDSWLPRQQASFMVPGLLVLCGSSLEGSDTPESALSLGRSLPAASLFSLAPSATTISSPSLVDQD